MNSFYRFLLILLLAGCAFSPMARAEVVVYNWKLVGAENISVDAGVTYVRYALFAKGFLVLNFNPATGAYTNPVLVKYWNYADKKYMNTENFLGGDGVVNFETKDFSGKSYVIISGFISRNSAEIYSGPVSTVSAAQAGGINPLNISKSLTGNAAWDRAVVVELLSSGRGKTYLQFNAARTQRANTSGQTVAQVVADLENNVAAKGYIRMPPTALDDSVETDMNTPVTVSVIANDYEPNPLGVFTNIELVSGATNGTAVVNWDPVTQLGDKTITYAPNTDWFGTDTFIYKVTDNYGGTATANVIVRVNYTYDTYIVSGDLTVTNTACILPSINRGGGGSSNQFFSFVSVQEGGNAIERYDRGHGITTEVAAGYPGQTLSPVGKTISDNGNYIVFESGSSTISTVDLNNFTDIFRFDFLTNSSIRVSVPNGVADQDANGNSYGAILSGDGNLVVFYSNANNLAGGATGTYDIFLRNVTASSTTLISKQSGAAPDPANADSINPCISGDGLYIVYESKATNLDPAATNGKSQIFVYDLTNQITGLVSRRSGGGAQGNGDSFSAYIAGPDSNSDYWIVYSSYASNLVDNDTNDVADIFLYNMTTGITTRVSMTNDNQQANQQSLNPQISEDAKYIVFESDASNLVKNDINGSRDIFLRIFTNPPAAPVGTFCVTVNSKGEKLKGDSFHPSIGTDGNYNYITYASDAANVVADDTDHFTDIYVQVRKGLFQ